ncbi:hypothetical protein [Vibrio sp. HN007]|uniref:hypothetical protein n=1 Tax=Vibrio iocasae TaxID=3098914 RepID=UPI0035D42F48
MEITKKLVLVFFLSTMLLFAVYVHAFWGDLDLYIAYYGVSAIDFSNSINLSDNFIDDFPGGAWSTGKSLLSWMHPALNGLGVDPMISMYLMISLEIAVLSLGVYLFSKSINKKEYKLVFILSVLLFIFSWSRLPNLAKFNNPYFHGQFYGFSDGLVLIAIAYALSYTNKFFIPLTLSFIIHPIKSLFGYVATTILLLSKSIQNNSIEWKGFIALFLSSTISILWFFVFIWSGNEEQMSQADFFFYTKLLNFHWFPEKVAMFSDMYYRYFVPYLSANLVFISICAFSDSLVKRVKSELFIIIVTLNVMALIGLLNSYLEFSTFLTKASIQRSSVLVLSIITVVFVNEVVASLARKKYIKLVFEVLIISVIFLEKTSWPILLCLSYTLFYVLDSNKGNLYGKVIVLFLAVFLFAIDQYFNYKFNSATWLYDVQLSYLYKAFPYFIFAMLILVLSKLEFVKITESKYFDYFNMCALFLVIANLSYSWSERNRILKPKFKSKAQSFLDVQLWSKTNTHPTSLFILEPCSLGWRDFSERSSFGTVNEWLKTAWLYTGSRHWLDEGLSRAKIFGINKEIINEYKDELSSTSTDKYCGLAEKTFYKDSFNFEKLNKEYSVDYIVSSKPINNSTAGQLVYKNDAYFVYKIDY